jgi:hypothetical protein
MFLYRRIGKARVLGVAAIAVIAIGGVAAASPAARGVTKSASGPVAAASSSVAVAPQYEDTHVYVSPSEVSAFVSSWEATFGGTNTAPNVTDVTPTSSTEISELVQSPVGQLSVFGFETGTPYPFGQERYGYLVTSLPAGVAAAERSGAQLVVSPWNDPIGKDAIIQFPGGVDLQLYWHTTAPDYAPLVTIPEDRVYLQPQAATEFIRDYLAFTKGTVTLDDAHANGAQIGLPGTTFREVQITSAFGKALVIVTNGQLPYPFGLDKTGYQVTNLAATLAKAKAAGATVLWGPYDSPALDSAIVEFPGGYIAEIHQGAS